MPDYYQTPGRNYDAEIARFISADPMPESATGMSTYHYAGDNPIMMNDPSGNTAAPVGSQSALIWAQKLNSFDFKWFPNIVGGTADALDFTAPDNEWSDESTTTTYAENEAAWSILLTDVGLSLDFSAKQYTVNSLGDLSMSGDVTDGGTQDELTSLMTGQKIGVNSGNLADLAVVNKTTGESHATFSESDDGEPLFNFLARNTLVEYSRCVYTCGEGQNWTLISTGHNFANDPQSWNEVKGLINSGDEILEFDHSHPNQPMPEWQGMEGPSGYFLDPGTSVAALIFGQSYGDRKFVNKVSSYSADHGFCNSIIYKVYDQACGSIMTYNPQQLLNSVPWPEDTVH